MKSIRQPTLQEEFILAYSPPKAKHHDDVAVFNIIERAQSELLEVILKI